MIQLINVTNSNHSKIKLKPVDVKSSTYIDYCKENNEKDRKLKIGDIVGISKSKTIFENVQTPNWG